MAFPAIPDTITPTTRDNLFSALSLDPGLAISMMVTNEYVIVEFVATDENGDLIRNAGNQIIHNFTIPVEAP